MKNFQQLILQTQLSCSLFHVHRKGIQSCSTSLYWKILQDYETSYQYKLQLAGPVHQNQQQIRLNIHTYTIQRCYYKRDWLHKHLGTDIHLNLRRLQQKIFIKWIAWKQLLIKWKRYSNRYFTMHPSNGK